MPQLLHRLVNQLEADGKSTDNAWAIATSELQKHGDLDAHAQLTAQGAQRQALGAAGRAKLRPRRHRVESTRLTLFVITRGPTGRHSNDQTLWKARPVLA